MVLPKIFVRTVLLGSPLGVVTTPNSSVSTPIASAPAVGKFKLLLGLASKCENWFSDRSLLTLSAKASTCFCISAWKALIFCGETPPGPSAAASLNALNSARPSIFTTRSFISLKAILSVSGFIEVPFTNLAKSAIEGSALDSMEVISAFLFFRLFLIRPTRVLLIVAVLFR